MVLLTLNGTALNGTIIDFINDNTTDLFKFKEKKGARQLKMGQKRGNEGIIEIFGQIFGKIIMKKIGEIFEVNLIINWYKEFFISLKPWQIKKQNLQ